MRLNALFGNICQTEGGLKTFLFTLLYFFSICLICTVLRCPSCLTRISVASYLVRPVLALPYAVALHAGELVLSAGPHAHVVGAQKVSRSLAVGADSSRAGGAPARLVAAVGAVGVSVAAQGERQAGAARAGELVQETARP